jgi:hypothetical protein
MNCKLPWQKAKWLQWQWSRAVYCWNGLVSRDSPLSEMQNTLHCIMGKGSEGYEKIKLLQKLVVLYGLHTIEIAFHLQRQESKQSCRVA